MEFPNNEFTGYVLAGGKSSRMGSDKAFLEIAGRTLLQNAVDILRAVCRNEIKVSLNKDQEHIPKTLPENLAPVFDIYDGRGPLGGIHAALRDCKTEFAAILAVDLPLVTPELVKQLARKAEEENVGATVHRLIDGKHLPLCGVFRPALCLAPLESAFEQSGSLSVRGFLKLVNVFEIETGYEHEFRNANTPSELEEIRRSLR